MSKNDVVDKLYQNKMGSCNIFIYQKRNKENSS